MPATKVGVIGAGGRMGSQACRTIEEADDLELVARVVRGHSLEMLAEAGAQVALDVTTPEAVAGNVRFLIDHGIHSVVGTTGVDAEDLASFERAAGERGTNVFIVPNFALGAVLMMRFAAAAAAHFESAEIIERHHVNKLDAPSGTSLRTAWLMDEVRSGAWSKPGSRESLAGARGVESHGVRIHSLRVAGSVAHQEVIFGGAGETLTIRHDSLDRTCFMAGVLLALRKVSSLPGLTVGLEHALDE